MAFSYLQAHLQTRREDALLRQRHLITHATAREITVAGKHYLNFASNDYLGFAEQPSSLLHTQALGCHSSPLVTGYQQSQHQLERYLCEQLGYQSALLFNSGFSANSSVLKALFQDKATAQNSAIFQDKLNHASLIDGALHSQAAMVRFNHNDTRHLTSRLEKSTAKNKLIISEGVFSMDGDHAPIATLRDIANSYNAWLMIDDAHGFGVLGENGLGSCEQIKPELLVITFGKAVASSGACVLASKEVIDYLLQFNRDYIYSTGMSPLVAELTLTRLQQIRSETGSQKRQQLADNISYFKLLATQHSLAVMPSTSAIQPIVLGCAEHTLAVANTLKEAGIWLTAIRPPTVPFNTSRLRITLTAAHTKADIECLIAALVNAL
ncbi:8-amino-7-oxononanoate synthase [Pseudoalteromonas haloplanktis]|uniref:8-amino-7-oxononanoate synthase n=1 Tax=Pseudoalteromonas haloplanktis TaxID=228 RepID=A0ABU1B869_PSEHA|nr:8-amino-7-oxononanoate synthase [Pseudoalteromonas haloplanktis]MDQ9090723.1 8-amino-7-oxononanoate synthase [Pseudoalteromonas haloplanktis]